MPPVDTDGRANSVDPGKTAHLVLSGSALFVLIRECNICPDMHNCKHRIISQYLQLIVLLLCIKGVHVFAHSDILNI